MMENVDNIDYLAANLGSVDLPILSGAEVYNELEISFHHFYDEFTANGFYTSMLYNYCNDPVISPCTSPEVSPSNSPPPSPIQGQSGGKIRRKSSKNRRDSGIFEAKSEDFDNFRLQLKRHRLRLGLTQAEAARSISTITNRKTSQTSLCRFENNQLHPKNMKNLYPHFSYWIQATAKL